MKVGTLAAIILSGLFAVSAAQATEPLSDVNAPSKSTSAQLTDDDSVMQESSSGVNSSGPSNDMSNIGADTGSNSTSSDNNAPTPSQAPADNDNSNGNDDMSADTATGDDDY